MSNLARQLIGEEDEDLRRLAMAGIAKAGQIGVDAADLIKRWMAKHGFEPGDDYYTIYLRPKFADPSDPKSWVLDLVVGSAKWRLSPGLYQDQLNRYLDAMYYADSVKSFKPLRVQLFNPYPNLTGTYHNFYTAWRV